MLVALVNHQAKHNGAYQAKKVVNSLLSYLQEHENRVRLVILLTPLWDADAEKASKFLLRQSAMKSVRFMALAFGYPFAGFTRTMAAYFRREN